MSESANYIDEVPSPLGKIRIIWNNAGLLYVEFAQPGERLPGALERHSPRRAPEGMLDSTPYSNAFARYFSGELDALRNLPVQLEGTEFELRVWRCLRRIRPGRTRTYGQVAADIGWPHAARAVGNANRRNPIGIAIPCHRVIGAHGRLSGYGGRPDRKRWLLLHEGVQLCSEGRVKRGVGGREP